MQEVVPREGFDLVIFALGFESRCTHLAGLCAYTKRAVAIPFLSNQNHQYTKNAEIFERADVPLLALPAEDQFTGAFGALVDAFAVIGSTPRIAVDISSFTRSRLAAIVATFKDATTFYNSQIDVRFFYSPAKFVAPVLTPPSILTAEPVSKRYRGRLMRSSVPVGAILGLGYEPQRAIGAYELLEPTNAWAFMPAGHDKEYRVALLQANRELIASVGTSSVFDYSVHQPVQTFAALESFIFSLADRYRLVLVPMGPKIFALMCLLLGAGASPAHPAVWRVGERAYTHELDAIADGSIVTFDVSFAKGKPLPSSSRLF